MKITVVGAGAVGASCAEYIAIKNFASEVVLSLKKAMLKERQWT
jgi:malate/lactate dehydrogenase